MDDAKASKARKLLILIKFTMQKPSYYILISLTANKMFINYIYCGQDNIKVQLFEKIYFQAKYNNNTNN